MNKDDVNDLTSNVYMSFAEQYQKIDLIENWLRKVLFLTFVKWYKKSRSKRTFELNEELTADDSNIKTDEGFDLGVALKALNQLSEEKQEIIKLRFWGDFKFSEIAEQLGKNESAVKKMFYRSIEELKNKIE